MLSVLSTAALRKDYEEQSAAVGATLLHLAHSPNTPSSVQKIYCDSLAMVGLWQQTLASAGTVPEERWYCLVRYRQILPQGGSGGNVHRKVALLYMSDLGSADVSLIVFMLNS
jgi:hypothetical protein